MVGSRDPGSGVRDALTSSTASELARLVREGSVTAKEVVQAHIDRIEEVDGRLNAVVVRRFEAAMAEADEADRAQERGDALGPLHGVPVTIKEQYLVADTPTTFGLPSRTSHRAERDGPLTARLREAGAIVLGKTNVSQMLIYFESDNPVYGRTNNPWALDRTPGGSSGGEAAIIAAGGSPLGLGGDLGGSIRAPAHYCGIAGLKPTSGRLSLLDTPGGVFFEQDVIVYQAGPMARSVADLGLAMSVLVSPERDALDPTVDAHAWPDFASVDVAGLHLGVFEDNGWFPASPGIRRGVRRAAAALEERGARISAFRPPPAGEALRVLLSVLSCDGLAAFRTALDGQQVDDRLKGFLMAASIPKVVRPLIAAVMGLAGLQHMALALRAVGPWTGESLRALADDVGRLQSDYLAALDAAKVDALVCPPNGLPALVHGLSDDLTVHTAGSYTSVINTLGFPAGVVPVTRVRAGEESDRPAGRGPVVRKALEVERGSAGLPVGVQVIGRPWREDVVLAVMAAVEDACRHDLDYPVTPTMVA